LDKAFPKSKVLLHPTRAALVHPSGAAQPGTPGVGGTPFYVKTLGESIVDRWRR